MVKKRFDGWLIVSVLLLVLFIAEVFIILSSHQLSRSILRLTRKVSQLSDPAAIAERPLLPEEMPKVTNPRDVEMRELEDVCDHVGVMSRGKLLLEHSLSELQDYTVKLQLAFEGAELPELPQEIKVLHHAQTGRVHTLICRGSAEELEQQLAALHPIFIDAVPLSLEEIFIYELGGEDYAIRDIVL